MNNISSTGSRHFRLEQLSDGIYAAINNNDTGWAICNAGIIDLGDRTLVFDTFMTPEAAKDLRNAAESLTGRPVHMVINSHYHNDHIWGNQAFPPEVDIISTHRTRELIAREGPLEIQGYRDVAQKRLEILEIQLAETDDKTTLDNLSLSITYFQAIVATLPNLTLRLPNITFVKELTFEGPKRPAKLISYEGGHCGSDAILHLPEDGIVFMEDLLFTGFHPYLPDGDPEILQRCLAEVRSLQPKILVPGHGPVGQMADLDEMDEYISTLSVLVSQVIKNGAAKDDMDKIEIPDKYQNWIFPHVFRDNLKFIYERQITSGAGLAQ